jgi:5-methylcytosine-specific restriction endonuclease McrA
MSRTWSAAQRRRRGKVNRSGARAVRWVLVYLLDGGRCYLCGVPTRLVSGKGAGRCLANRHTVDHVVPVAKGGADRLGNLRACCLRCNRAKADAMPSAASSAA